MTDSPLRPERYTMKKLGGDFTSLAPELIRGAPGVLMGLLGKDHLGAHTRLSVQLRMAKLMGCPVCLALFPAIGARAGLHELAIQSSIRGDAQGLTEQAFGAMSWVQAIIEGNGAEPSLVPGPSASLTAPQRANLLYMTRLEIVVHSAGLMLLPHNMIERARRDD